MRRWPERMWRRICLAREDHHGQQPSHLHDHRDRNQWYRSTLNQRHADGRIGASMRALRTLLVLLLAVSGVAAIAQSSTRAEVALNYTYVHSNAPPGGCGCFSWNGGSAAAAWHFNDRFAVVGDFARGLFRQSRFERTQPHARLLPLRTALYLSGAARQVHPLWAGAARRSTRQQRILPVGKHKLHLSERLRPDPRRRPRHRDHRARCHKSRTSRVLLHALSQRSQSGPKQSARKRRHRLPIWVAMKTVVRPIP